MLIVVFAIVLFFSFLLIFLLSRPTKADKVVEQRLHAMTVANAKHSDVDHPELLEQAPEGRFHRIGEYLQRFHFSKDLQVLISHAGSNATVGSVVAGSILTAVGAGVLVHVTVGALPLELAAMAAGAASRWGLLKFQKGRRLKQFNDALPDAIDLLARALRAGHSMNSSIEIVAEQSAEPLASEYAIVFQQQKFGVQFRDALIQLGERVPSKDLQFLITAILVQKETGGDLTEVLDRTTRIIRERIRLHGEIQTYTAQGRLTGWILSALPVGMLVLINVMTPGYSHLLFHDPLGQKLLYAGCTLIVIGGLIIRKIVDIEV